MTVESATYISDLVAANPASGDPKSEGDDHIRLLKSTIKATFPNINAAVTLTDEALNAIPAVPSGTYTPTLTGVANFNAGSSAPNPAQWMRAGSVVTVSGAVTVAPTAAGGASTVLGISLPVASALAGFYQLGGTAQNTSGVNSVATLVGDGVNARAQMSFFATSTTAVQWSYIFTYLVV